MNALHFVLSLYSLSLLLVFRFFSISLVFCSLFLTRFSLSLSHSFLVLFFLLLSLYESVCGPLYLSLTPYSFFTFPPPSLPSLFLSALSVSVYLPLPRSFSASLFISLSFSLVFRFISLYISSSVSVTLPYSSFICILFCCFTD